MMQESIHKDTLRIVRTTDGSQTLESARFGQHYHSIHGAIQESKHVFIDHGLLCLDQKKDLRILELGLGTGLNALLVNSLLKDRQEVTRYISYEAFPLAPEIYDQLDYCKMLAHASCSTTYELIHRSAWSVDIPLSPSFIFRKELADIRDGIIERDFDLVIFDAFSPNSQPELWTSEFFSSLYLVMKEGGILSTYCAKGDVRRSMQLAGFLVKKLPGPPGKREMLQALKV